MPAHPGPVPRGQPQQTHGEGQAGKTDAPVGGVVVAQVGLDEDDGGDEGDEDEPTRQQAPLGRHNIGLAEDGPVPQFAEGCGETAGGGVPEDEAGHDSQPDEERDHPVLVCPVEDESGDPPSVYCFERSFRWSVTSFLGFLWNDERPFTR